MTDTNNGTECDHKWFEQLSDKWRRICYKCRKREVRIWVNDC